MKFSLVFLLALISSPAFAARNVNLAWDASASAEVVSYRLYTTTTKGTYTFGTTAVATVPAAQLTYSLLNLSDATPTWAVVTAVGTSGLESGPSNEIIITGPAAPARLRLVLQ